MVLEKTLGTPLDCKEIQLVHPKGDQSWVFIGRTEAKAETPGNDERMDSLAFFSLYGLKESDMTYGLVCSPCCPRESQESSPTPQFNSISSLVPSLLYGPNLLPIHDY